MSLAKPKRLAQVGSTPAHSRSRKQEREVARRLGGKTTLASGALSEKGDVRLKGVVRIECKTTMAKSFSVTKEMIEKIEHAALSAGELPAVVVEFITPKGKPLSSVAVVPMWALDMVAQCAKTKDR
jgi:Holliday junction resolvase